MKHILPWTTLDCNVKIDSDYRALVWLWTCPCQYYRQSCRILVKKLGKYLTNTIQIVQMVTALNTCKCGYKSLEIMWWNTSRYTLFQCCTAQNWNTVLTRNWRQSQIVVKIVIILETVKNWFFFTSLTSTTK
jgi:hypothetical protein